MIDGPLEHDATYWNEEYKRCFGDYPIPPVAYGVDMKHVHFVQSAVMRYWVEAVKQSLQEKETINGQTSQI